MRTAKYHDYTVLRIVLFIVLVILGLFIYLNFIKGPEHTAPDNSWVVITKATCDSDGLKCKVCTDCGEQFGHEVIPAKGHNALAPQKENEKAHTTTEGGSYDKVTYCKDCGDELSREKVYINGEHKTEIVFHQENATQPDCDTPGIYELVGVCKVCDEELSRELKAVDPTGHKFGWELLYDESTKKYTLVGDCVACDKDSGHVEHTEADGLKIVPDSSVCSCCAVRYLGVYDGKPLASIDFEATTNHTVRYYPDLDGYLPEEPVVSELPEPKFDDRSNKYYYDISEVKGIQAVTNAEYDKFGFSRGTFRCTTCADPENECSYCSDANHYFIVYIYNPEYDTYLDK